MYLSTTSTTISDMGDFELTVIYILTGILGLCVGSFLNVVIYRVPEGMSLATPPSHCPRCGYRLKWYDNIPLLSYTILGGKCRSCKEHISFRYTAVEFTNAVLWLICAFVFCKTDMVWFIAGCLVCSLCICVFFIDLEHMLIYDRFQIMLVIAALVMLPFDARYDWISHIIGLVAAAVVFIGVAYVVGKILGREALGGGDVKLAMAAGLMLGWQRFLLMMLIASLSASAAMLILRKKNRASEEIPFGPFLTTGLVIALLAGDYIIKWYLELLII